MALLDQRLPEICHRGSLRIEQRARDRPLAARACSGGVQRCLDEHAENMRQRRQTVEPSFGTIKSWMEAPHFQMKILKSAMPLS
jgi:hypothetical protein